MHDNSFALEAERFIATLDGLTADDFAGPSSTAIVAGLLRTTEDMDELQDALDYISSKKLGSIPADDVLDNTTLWIALAQNPYLQGNILEQVLTLANTFPGLLVHLAGNGYLSEPQAIRIAVSTNTQVLAALAANPALPAAVYRLLAAHSDLAVLCPLLGNRSASKEAKDLIPAQIRGRYEETVVAVITKIHEAEDTGQVAQVYSPALDERMDVAAVMSPYLPAAAAVVLEAKGSVVVRSLLEVNRKKCFYRYSCM